MNVRVLPQRPVIFVGLPFTVQLTVSSGKGRVGGVTARVVGRMSGAQDSIKEVIGRVLGGEKGGAAAAHVMSDVCQVCDSVEGERTFCVTVTAEDVPPSFDGVYSSISYELVVSCAGGSSVSCPLVFVAKYGYDTPISVSRTQGRLKLECVEGSSVSSKLCVSCPFACDISTHESDFIVNQKSGVVAKLSIPTAVCVGSSISGWIDLTNSTVGVTELKVSLVRIEHYPPNKEEHAEVSTRSIELTGLVGRRFTVAVPYTCTANFSTDMVGIKYQAEFLFSLHDGHKCKWVCDMNVLPPEFSLTKPRCPHLVKQ